MVPTSAQDSSLARPDSSIDDITSISIRDTVRKVGIGGHHSGYDKIDVTGGSKAVDANLVADDEYKQAWFDWHMMEDVFDGYYYDFKRKLKKDYRLAIGSDYMYLNQFASFSYSNTQATSGIFRFFGHWRLFGKSDETHGSFVFKIENRHNMTSGVPPRNLGYEAGSALSTASFKDMGWGLTNFYWKQIFKDKWLSIVVGQMDPGDWTDLFPQLNSYVFYMNEAFFNNPGMALPNQGFGFAAKSYLYKQNIYVEAGIHDANGEPNISFSYIFDSFFNTREFFSWIEAGWEPSDKLSLGEGIHLTYWYQDPRTEANTKESWGFCFSASRYIGSGLNPFIRFAYSEGDAAIMHHLAIVGLVANFYRHDYMGIGINWGGPSDTSKRDQYGLEAFYSFQITQHFNVTPDLQMTVYPSFNPDKDVIGIVSVLRLRYAI